tara:strand:+ start:36 stop:884 length:849 start_codon:yes stop_codon:yes gene_type:complete
MGGNSSRMTEIVSNNMLNESDTKVQNKVKNEADVNILQKNRAKIGITNSIIDTINDNQQNNTNIALTMQANQQSSTQIADQMQAAAQNALAEALKQSNSGPGLLNAGNSNNNKQFEAISNHISNITHTDIDTSLQESMNINLKEGNDVEIDIMNSIMSGDIDINQDNMTKAHLSSVVSQTVDNIANTKEGSSVSNSMSMKAVQKNAACAGCASCGLCCMIIVIVALAGGSSIAKDKGIQQFVGKSFNKAPITSGGGKILKGIKISDIFIGLLLFYIIYMIYK